MADGQGDEGAGERRGQAAGDGVAAEAGKRHHQDGRQVPRVPGGPGKMGVPSWFEHICFIII